MVDERSTQPNQELTHPLAEPVSALLRSAALSVSGGDHWARLCADIPPEQWQDAATKLRDDPALDLTFFDWLSAVDNTDTETDPHFAIICHLWSVTRHHGILLRTSLPADNPHLASLIDIFPGAAWHERETFEMFGITFDNHPNLRKLLLSDEFDGHPLRKDFVLASRVIKEWPGAKEPGQSDHAPTRRRMLPPGVPQPGEWGGAS